MMRFYWTFGAAIAVTAATWTISALAQPLPGAPPPAGAPLPLLFSPVGPMPAGFPPPFPPVIPPFAGAALAPYPPPPVPGHVIGGRMPVGEICVDRIARRLALRAYLKERLNLNAQQLSAWQDFENAATEADTEERLGCSKMAATPDGQTIVKRIDMAEEMLTRRLAQMQKVGAPLRKVIATLSPDQLRLLEQVMPPVPPMAL
jgi:hypothetical protein